MIQFFFSFGKKPFIENNEGICKSTKNKLKKGPQLATRMVSNPKELGNVEIKKKNPINEH